jgi:hypothetical protein|tara:strand:- start:3744 stop:3869 length:126 start_codon:yes stop_codon:yes gene_type:complete
MIENIMKTTIEEIYLRDSLEKYERPFGPMVSEQCSIEVKGG